MSALFSRSSLSGAAYAGPDTCCPARRFLLLAALVMLAACGSDPADRQLDRLTVVVSIPPQAEFVQRIGGKWVDVIVMVPVGAQPHTYEPTPRQLARVSTARVYIKLGSGINFERIWMPRIRSVNPDLTVVDCAAGIEVVDNDPHTWLSPRLARVMADTIRAALVRLAPEHEADFARGFAEYATELRALDAELREGLRHAGIRRFMVYHPSWGYFAREYGLRQIAVEHEGKEPSARHLGDVVEQMRAQRIDAVFVSPQFDTRAARAVAAETGARVLTVDPLAPHYTAELRRFGASLMGQASSGDD